MSSSELLIPQPSSQGTSMKSWFKAGDCGFQAGTGTFHLLAASTCILIYMVPSLFSRSTNRPQGQHEEESMHKPSKHPARLVVRQIVRPKTTHKPALLTLYFSPKIVNFCRISSGWKADLQRAEERIVGCEASPCAPSTHGCSYLDKSYFQLNP